MRYNSKFFEHGVATYYQGHFYPEGVEIKRMYIDIDEAVKENFDEAAKFYMEKYKAPHIASLLAKSLLVT